MSQDRQDWQPDGRTMRYIVHHLIEGGVDEDLAWKVYDEHVDKAPDEPSLQLMAASRGVTALRDLGALWRQEREQWWVRKPSGVWASEEVEEVDAALYNALGRAFSRRFSASLASSVKTLLRPDMAQSAKVFDRDPWLLGVDNGIVDLRTGQLLVDEAEHYITRCAPVRFVPGAVSEEWVKHVDDLFDGDEEVAHCYHKQIGAALVGDAQTEKPQVYVCLVGPQGGGKGEAGHTLLAVLGSHAEALRSQDFVEGNDRHTQWLTSVRGARLAIVEEMKGKTLDVALLKSLSGGDTVIANEMRMADSKWVPTHTLFFSSNVEPDFGNDPEGQRRRYVPLPTGPERWEDDTDGMYARKLRSNLEGILAWCIDGTRLWLEEDGGGRIVLPTKVTDLRDGNIAGHDQAEQFIADEVHIFGAGDDGDVREYKCHRAQVRKVFAGWLIKKGDVTPLAQKDQRLTQVYNRLSQMRGVNVGQPSIVGIGQSDGWFGARVVIERDRDGSIIEWSSEPPYKEEQ